MAKETNDFPHGTNPDGTPVTAEQLAELTAKREAVTNG
jgi:hypothetical protein